MAEGMREMVRNKYAELALASRGGGEASCCGSSCGCGEGETALRVSDLSRGSYSAEERGELPAAAVGASLGCGNPTALARDEYEEFLAQAGFEDVSVEVTSTYDPETIDGLDTEEGREALRRVPAVSAFVRATRPGEE